MVKKKGNKNIQLLIKTTAALLGAAALFVLWPWVKPLADALLGQATLVSAVLTMPDGAALTLQERFAAEVIPPDEIDTPPDDPEVHPPASSSSSSSPPRTDEPGFIANADIPPEYQAALVENTVQGDANNLAFIQWQSGWIRNYTKLTREKILEVLATPDQLALTPGKEPQVLIYHTHTTESYDSSPGVIYDTRNTWRDTNKEVNMAKVGDALAKGLEAQGISVIHDTTLHDYPSYNGAYDRSRITIQKYLKKYPSIRVAIDVHRDAVIYDDLSVLKPVVTVAGKKAAQLMICAPCDDGSVGVPNWQNNFRFAAGLTAALEEAVPGITRPVFFCYRNYNLDMTSGSLLFEFGTNGNTLEEAIYSAELTAPVLAEYLISGK
ncbi:MAG: stage II sporulation protein P [Angelakisella sp.]|nr:stage II sporulation protein P [Angelakisella sp.]